MLGTPIEEELGVKRGIRYLYLNLLNLNWSQAQRNHNQRIANLIFKFFIEFILELVDVCHIFNMGFFHSRSGKRGYSSVVGG
jgi:hypothetical protein